MSARIRASVPLRRKGLFPRRSRPSALEVAGRDLARYQNETPADLVDRDELALRILCFKGAILCTLRALRERGEAAR